MPQSKKLPSDFLKLLEKNIGTDDINRLVDTLDDGPTVSIRFNPNKSLSLPSHRSIPWCSNGYYLPDRPRFTLDPLFHAGVYYVQEPSSMFLEQFINIHFNRSEKIKALDLCAAPGGKTTHLLSLLNKDSLLVSNEVIRSRASILSENVQKWGNANVVVTQNDPSDFKTFGGYFNLIVVDAPCSGEGLFRKDNTSVNEWSLKSVEHCSQRQRRILADIFPALEQNGLMIYCTCTYNQIENEENLKWLSQQGSIEFIKIPEAGAWGIEEVNFKGVVGYRFMPHRLQGEGFFISGFVKRENSRTKNTFKTKHHGNNKLAHRTFDAEFLKARDQLQFASFNESIVYFPKEWWSDISDLCSFLRCLQIGTAAGSEKRDKFIPSHSLALSNELDRNAWPSIELDKDDALRYLSKEVVSLPLVSNGYSLVTYKKVGLGWINKIENRYNNLYPTQWRIKMNTRDVNS